MLCEAGAEPCRSGRAANHHGNNHASKHASLCDQCAVITDQKAESPLALHTTIKTTIVDIIVDGRALVTPLARDILTNRSHCTRYILVDINTFHIQNSGFVS